MGILVFLFLGIIVLINIVSLITSLAVKGGKKKVSFFTGLAFNGGATIFCFIGGLSGSANFHAGGIFPAFCLLGFWFFYVFTAINALSLYGKNRKKILSIILIFSLFPSYLFISETLHRYKFYQICENDYEYKIHKKIQLPRQYFHVATKEEADKEKRWMQIYDYVPNDYLRIEEGDLVANYEEIELKDFLRNIREKKIFKQDRVYVIGFFPKKCGDNIKELEKIDFDKYGRFMCTGIKFIKDKSYSKDYTYSIDLNTGEKLSEVNSFNYSYFGRLRKFIISSKKIKCSKRPISILPRDLIELKK